MNTFHYRHRIIVHMQKYCKQRRMRYKRLLNSSTMPKCDSCRHNLGEYECDRDKQLCVFTESSMYEPRDPPKEVSTEDGNGYDIVFKNGREEEAFPYE